jgi:hypothetical protein
MLSAVLFFQAIAAQTFLISYSDGEPQHIPIREVSPMPDGICVRTIFMLSICCRPLKSIRYDYQLAIFNLNTGQGRRL